MMGKNIVVLKNSLLQIFQVAPSLHMVELRKAGGDTLEFQKVWIYTLNFYEMGNALKGHSMTIEMHVWE